MPKVALVIGISSMDGAALCDLLLSKGYSVVGTYRKNACINLEEIHEYFNNDPRLTFDYCDINDFESIKNVIVNTLEKFYAIDELYLIAAQSNVGFSFQSPESTVITNGMSAFYFLENLRQLSKNTRLMYCGTSELLGGDPKDCPFDENSAYECRSPYSIGKELGTRWVKYYHQTYGIFATYNIIFNHSNFFRKKDFYIRRVTNSAARIALGKQKELTLGNLNFYRDESWADFVMEAAWKTIQLDNPEVFVICRGTCNHGEEFLDEAFGYFNLDWKKYVKQDKSRFRDNEVVKLVGTPQKAIEKIGWSPNRMSFKKHIELMCEYDYLVESGQKAPKRDILSEFPAN